MKKRAIMLLLALMFSVSGIIAGNKIVYAETSAEDVDISALWVKDALVGYAQNQTKGVYLARGYSIINDAGGGRIGCGGVTSAASKCKVGITAIVERKEGDSWVRVTSWTNRSDSAYSISVSKYLAVGSGYYYRVRCVHYAETDVSNSYTGALLM